MLILLSSCDSGTATTDEPTPDTAMALDYQKKSNYIIIR